MGKDKKGKDSYYELPLPGGVGAKEILLTIAVLAFIGLPIYMIPILASVLKHLGLTSAGYVIFVIVLAVIILFGWPFLLSRLRIRPFINIKPRGYRYRLKVPDADKYFTVIRDADGAVIGKAERKGALWFSKEPDAGFFSFTYNLFADNGSSPSERIRVYEVTKEMFLEQFPYYEEHLFRYSRIWVIPYEDLGFDREGFKALKNTGKERELFLFHADLSDLADGLTYERDYGESRRYGDVRKGIRPDKASVDRFLKEIYKGPGADNALKPAPPEPDDAAFMGAANSAANSASNSAAKSSPKSAPAHSIPAAFGMKPLSAERKSFYGPAAARPGNALSTHDEPALDEPVNDEYGFDESLGSKLDERINHLSDSFSTYLLYLIKSKNMDNAEVYKRALVDKKTFSKIKNNEDYHPQKLTALCLCMGLELSIDETKDLLARAGYALSPCDKTDVIFRYFIENGIYDMIELDIQLEEHGLPCIIK